ncbi:gastrula zinc finger protein XlCGF51.1A-like [Sinocyclocheilus rhinocerous]|uniref:gastrula zinc finger protein XlCGF51.1A-like n=1 Tax=Sinocyclocheilus rhinocerous TaxID=307959 RepID=UPI0007BA6C31|nr:PREDICTED: gastrula zinc finger protein XlCGF51.1A-like [Sinocyclocheilus rhinocerous]
MCTMPGCASCSIASTSLQALSVRLTILSVCIGASGTISSINTYKGGGVTASDAGRDVSGGYGETASTSKDQLKAKSFSCITCEKTFVPRRNLVRIERKQTEQKDFSCEKCDSSFPNAEERRLRAK